MIERLQIFIDSQSISIRAFEIKIGASDGMIRRAIKNSTDIQSKWLSNIADNYPQLNLEWLITGRGEMISTFFETKCVQKVIKENDTKLDPFYDTERNVQQTLSIERDPRDAEILELHKKHITLLEQQVAQMADHISDLKKELEELYELDEHPGFVVSEASYPAASLAATRIDKPKGNPRLNRQ